MNVNINLKIHLLILAQEIMRYKLIRFNEFIYVQGREKYRFTHILKEVFKCYW